jgi:hypothetical protein
MSHRPAPRLPAAARAELPWRHGCGGHRQLARARTDAPDAWPQARDRGQALLARYLDWAPGTDRFAPVLVETDFEVNILHPHYPQTALVASDREPIRYTGRIDMMAVDQHDAYWIVRHRVVDGDWPATAELAADEEARTACWAWEQFYLGMAITGTIYNELRPNSDPDPAAPTPAPPPAGTPKQRRPWRRPRPSGPKAPQVRQHEPSGGGRMIPQHRRMYAQAIEPPRVEPIEQVSGDGFRRTYLRRTPAEVAEAGRRLGADVAEMISADLDITETPDDQNCPPCPFLDPCLAMRQGRDAAPPKFPGRDNG